MSGAKALVIAFCGCSTAFAGLVRMSANAPEGETRDLKVGLWAFPMVTDWNGDGRPDLVVSSPCQPYRGTYLFLNRGKDLFAKAQRISDEAYQETTMSRTDGKDVVLRPGLASWDFRHDGYAKAVAFPPNVKANPHPFHVRGNIWRFVDYDGDGRDDLVVGVGCWKTYGWDNAYDAAGVWTNTPIRSAIYLYRNVRGSGSAAEYADAVELWLKDGSPFETYGNPAPMLADWDGDGDLDILCGSFIDDFHYFENVGSRTVPAYVSRGKLMTRTGARLTMDLEMIKPTPYDWDGDGRLDVICGDEDGRVAFIRNVGKDADGKPLFEAPVYFRQEADELNFGALSTPWAVDWDGDGDQDIISGNSAGYLAFIENLSGKGVAVPRWAEPKLIKANGKTIRIQAGANGSIQGPAEAKWGYTVCSVADWDGDGFNDIMVNSIFGDVVWYRNPERKGCLDLEAPRPVEVEWNGPQPSLAWGWRKPQGKALLTQWRTTPVMVDWNRDGLMDLAVLDAEGYLCLFERFKNADGVLRLRHPRRVFANQKGVPLRLNAHRAGRSGRRKICFADWDGDGRLDLIVNGINADWMRNLGEAEGVTRFADPIPLDSRVLSSHTTAPCPCDFDGDGRADLLIGAEDGYFYRLSSAQAISLVPRPRKLVEKGGVTTNAAVRYLTDAAIPAEGYRLSVTPEGTVVSASDEAGRFYAGVTRDQLRISGDGKRPDAWPCVEIEDSPAYRWRGLMIDEGRHFFGKDVIKRVIDRMALHKLNRLHWHLTEDQGWRLDVPGYPELVRYGAVRSASPRHGVLTKGWLPLADNIHYLNDERYGPYFYTEKDVREIVAYAAARHVVIVPEIELPGHVYAALAAYPRFACCPENLKARDPRVFWGIEKDVLCLGNDEALKFFEDVLDYVCRIFPGDIVHIGGDECPQERWKTCPKCQARIRAEGLKDEKGLQPWVTRRIVKFLAARGKRTLGWDEYLLGDVPKSAIGMSWREDSRHGAGHELVSGAAAALRGHDVVMTPKSFCYLDYGQGLADDPFLYGGGCVTLADCHRFDPCAGVPAEARARVLGGQGNCWSEYIWNLFDLDWKTWPRACALAEALWLGRDKPGFDDFLARMRVHRRRLVAVGVNCAHVSNIVCHVHVEDLIQ